MKIIKLLKYLIHGYLIHRVDGKYFMLPTSASKAFKEEDSISQWDALHFYNGWTGIKLGLNYSKRDYGEELKICEKYYIQAEM